MRVRFRAQWDEAEASKPSHESEMKSKSRSKICLIIFCDDDDDDDAKSLPFLALGTLLSFYIPRHRNELTLSRCCGVTGQRSRDLNLIPETLGCRTLALTCCCCQLFSSVSLSSQSSRIPAASATWIKSGKTSCGLVGELPGCRLSFTSNLLSVAVRAVDHVAGTEAGHGA